MASSIGVKASEQFFGDLAALRGKAFKFVEDSEGARKTVRTGKEDWEWVRDLMPHGQAIEKATRVTEVIGRAIGILGENAAPASRPAVQVVVPLFIDARAGTVSQAGELAAGQVRAMLDGLPSPPGDDEPAVIDIKAGT